MILLKLTNVKFYELFTVILSSARHYEASELNTASSGSKL